jgi:circadian clock protein KaiC
MTGAARVAQVSRDRAEALRIQFEVASRQNALQRKRSMIERQVAALQAEQETEEEEFRRYDVQVADRARALTAERKEMGRARHIDNGAAAGWRAKSRVGRTK